MKHLSGRRSIICGEGDPCQFLACLLMEGVRLVERWYTGRFLVPYFILIFASVKIKDKSELQQGFKQEKKNTQGGSILFGNH